MSRMLPRFHLSDLSTVGHHIGTLVVLTGILMCLPLAIALLFGEFASAVDFVFGIGCCTLAGSALRLLKARRVDRRCSLLLTGFSWIVVGFMAAIPMFCSGGFGSFADALFDSVSSITTTGASLALNIDAMSYSQIVWHAVLTLAGGQAVIVIAVYMGFFGEGSFATVATTRGYSDLVSTEFAKSTRQIWLVTAAFTGGGTIVAFIIGLAIGIPPAEAVIDAFCLASNAANTGGFVPHTSSLVYYHNALMDSLVLVLIGLGAVNLGIFSLAMRGKWREIAKNSEFRALALWAVVFVICISAGLTHDAVYTTFSGLVDRGMFMSIAAIATSGMQTVYPEQLTSCFSDGVLILLMLATFLGASACSTAGGVKTLRVMEVLRWFGYTIFRAILPDRARMSIRYNYFGTRTMTPLDATRAMTIMILYLAAAALGAMAFIAYGNDALPSVLESISYVCNSGITVGLLTPDSSPFLKGVAILQMWAGRLEFIALIAAIAGIVISIRPLPRNAGGGRASRESREKRRAARLQRRKSSRQQRMAANPNKPTHHEAAQHEPARNELPAHHEPSQHEKGSASTGTLVVIVLVVAALALTPVSAHAAQITVAAPAGGASVPASQIESLKSEDAETYRDTAIKDLLAASERLDEHRVKVSGTVYGAQIVDRGKNVWLNIKDGSAMVGVTLPSKEAEKITGTGGYWQSGDKVTVTATYHRACTKHHGELDLHGYGLTIDQESQPLEHPADPSRLGVGLALIALGFGAMWLKRIIYGKSKRKRKLLGLA